MTNIFKIEEIPYPCPFCNQNLKYLEYYRAYFCSNKINLATLGQHYSIICDAIDNESEIIIFETMISIIINGFEINWVCAENRTLIIDKRDKSEYNLNFLLSINLYQSSIEDIINKINLLQ